MTDLPKTHEELQRLLSEAHRKGYDDAHKIIELFGEKVHPKRGLPLLKAERGEDVQADPKFVKGYQYARECMAPSHTEVVVERVWLAERIAAGQRMVEAIEEWMIARATGNNELEHKFAERIPPLRNLLRRPKKGQYR